MGAKLDRKHLLGNKQADCLKPCKGRSQVLRRLRDLAIVKAFYKHSEIERRRLDDVLKIMSAQEFYLCERTIWDIIRAHTNELDTLSRGESIDDPKPVEDKRQMKLEI